MKNWKEWVIFKPIKDLYNSLFNDEHGFSFRKASAVFGLYASHQVTMTIKEEVYKFYATCLWTTFVAVCIGLVTIPELIKFLNKDNANQPTQQ